MAIAWRFALLCLSSTLLTSSAARTIAETRSSKSKTKPVATETSVNETEFIPDEYLYPHDFEGPKEISAETQEKVDHRVARCYDPQLDGVYTAVDWKTPLDKYMNAQATRGLRKVPKVITYNMPHVWGEHWFTKYFPHHWIAAIIPDIEAAPSSYCMEFDYEKSTEDTDDPNGCLFFKKSFQPTQKLAKCVMAALDASNSYMGRQAVMRADSSLYKAKFGLSLAGEGSNPQTLTEPLHAFHALWNDQKIIPKRHVENKNCSVWDEFQDQQCIIGTTVKVIEPCKSFYDRAFGASSKLSLLCETRSAGGDEVFKEMLTGKDLVIEGQLCNTSAIHRSLEGAVLLVEAGGCDRDQKVATAAEAGAVVVLLRSDGARHGEKHSTPGGKLPIPTFTVEDSDVTAHLEALIQWKKDNVDRAAGGALRIQAYEQVLPEDAEFVPNFQEEVRTWQVDEDKGWVAWANTRDRAYEVMKKVSLKVLGRKSLAQSKYHVARAFRISMTQPETSKYDQIDPETEQALFQCYGLGNAATSQPTCKTLKVLSLGHRVEYGHTDTDQAEFFLGGEPIMVDAPQGINVIVIDPETQRMVDTKNYDPLSERGAAEEEMLKDFSAMPEGHIVLVAVKSAGMWQLGEAGVKALKLAGAERAGQGRKEEGYALIGQIGGPRLAEDVDRWAMVESMLPCPADESGQMSNDASITHEASKCLAAMWDKVEVGGQPYPQVSEASGSFPGDNLRVKDTLTVHPLCSRLSVALFSYEMSSAPYPNPDEWEPGDKFGISTAYDAFHKGNPKWLAKHMTDYCMEPDTAVCTSFTVCWAMLTRHVTKLIHPLCDEKARIFAEMPASED